MGNVRQPDRVLANWVAGHQPERRPGASEEWGAMTEHVGAEVESILINKTKAGQAFHQVWSGDVNVPDEPSLKLAQHGPGVTLDQRGVGADRLQGARHDPLRLASPRRREVLFLRVPIGQIFVPIAHDLVGAATIHTAGQLAYVLYEVTKERGAWPHFQMVDVPVEGLRQPIDELRHAGKSPPKGLQDSLICR